MPRPSNDQAPNKRLRPFAIVPPPPRTAPRSVLCDCTTTCDRESRAPAAGGGYSALSASSAASASRINFRAVFSATPAIRAISRTLLPRPRIARKARPHTTRCAPRSCAACSHSALNRPGESGDFLIWELSRRLVSGVERNRQSPVRQVGRRRSTRRGGGG